MITIKLFSYAPDDGVKQTEFVFDNESMNDVSLVDKIMSAAIIPYQIIYTNFGSLLDDNSVREIVLAFPSFMAEHLDSISSYLYEGLCLAFVECYDKLSI